MSWLRSPQERYDIVMNNVTEHTWTIVTFSLAIGDLMKTDVQYPPRPLQSESYSGPITLTQSQRVKSLRDELAKEGIGLPMPTGN